MLALLAAATSAADRGGSNEAAIALAGALVGAGIAVGYDLVKSRRMDRKRDILVMQLLVNDLVDVEVHLDAVTMRAEAQRATGVVQAEPMPMPASELWEILRLGIPEDLLEDDVLMTDLRAVHVGVRHLGEVLEAREARRRIPPLTQPGTQAIFELDGIVDDRIKELRPVLKRALASVMAHIATR